MSPRFSWLIPGCAVGQQPAEVSRHQNSAELEKIMLDMATPTADAYRSAFLSGCTSLIQGGRHETAAHHGLLLAGLVSRSLFLSGSCAFCPNDENLRSICQQCLFGKREC